MAGNLQYYEDFCIPLDVSRMQNDRMKLVPFESDFEKHAKIYVAQVTANPDIIQYIPYGPWTGEPEFVSWYQSAIKAKKDIFWFAIILHKGTVKRKTRRAGEALSETFEVEEGTMAGITGLCRAEPDSSVVEIGHVLTFPAFWGTFVTATAHGLLLQHLLNPAPDLNFRRVQWQANARNEASRRTALRLGFHFEGIIRWQRLLIENKPAELESDRGTLAEPQRTQLPGVSPTGKKLTGGRHSAMFSLCWDDWLDGAKEQLQRLMATYD